MKNRITCTDIGEICDSCANGELYPCPTWQKSEYIKEYFDKCGYLDKEIKRIFLSIHNRENVRLYLPLYKVVIERYFPMYLDLFNKLLLLI
jgi:hypothetical protein